MATNQNSAANELEDWQKAKKWLYQVVKIREIHSIDIDYFAEIKNEKDFYFFLKVCKQERFKMTNKNFTISITTIN